MTLMDIQEKYDEIRIEMMGDRRAEAELMVKDPEEWKRRINAYRAKIAEICFS